MPTSRVGVPQHFREYCLVHSGLWMNMSTTRTEYKGRRELSALPSCLTSFPWIMETLPPLRDRWTLQPIYFYPWCCHPSGVCTCWTGAWWEPVRISPWRPRIGTCTLRNICRTAHPPTRLSWGGGIQTERQWSCWGWVNWTCQQRTDPGSNFWNHAPSHPALHPCYDAYFK